MKESRKKVFYDYFENLAPTYTKYRNKFTYYWHDIADHINFYITEEDSVLEVGCGVGHTLAKLKAKEKVGVDFSPAMIEEAKKQHKDIDFQLMDAENIQLDRTFDVIVLANTVGFFENVLDVFHELRKVSTPQTRIFISYYNYFWEPALKLGEWLGWKKSVPKQSWLSMHDITNLLYLADFEVYHRSRRVIFPFKIPLFSAFMNRFVAKFPVINSFALNQFAFARPVVNSARSDNSVYSTTVVVPARNESGNIEDAVLRLPNFGRHIELIFIEGNSTDDTWQEIQRVKEKYAKTHDIKIMQQDGKGKGDAVRKAYSHATGDILMILDADLTVPPEDLPKFYDALATGKGEFINGSRLVYPMEDKAMRYLNTLGNKFFSVVFSWLLSQPIKDTLCGTKVMFRKDYEKLAANRAFFGDFDPFGDFDLLFGAYKLNLKVIDLPIRYQERTYGDTNISRFKHGLLLLRMVFFAAFKLKFR